MRWPLSEYVLKGFFLGLLFYAGLTVPVSTAVYGLAIGLAVGLGAAVAHKLAEGLRPAGHPISFLLFILVESPGLIYAGTLFGLAISVLAFAQEADRALLSCILASGIVIGLAIAAIQRFRRPRDRSALGIFVAILIVAAISFVPQVASGPEDRASGLFSLMLFGAPVYYLLAFVGVMEENEGDVAAFCTLLVLGGSVLTGIPGPVSSSAALLYPVYLLFVLPRLRVFKHTLRGLSYARLGRYQPALIALRRAAQIDPANRRAREALWEVHRDLDAAKIAAEPGLVNLIDPYLCLDRAAALLVADRPGEAQRAEANHLLDLVAEQAPTLLPQVTYWRTVADTHAGQLDRAAAGLVRLLDPAAWPNGDPARQAVLVPAWQLALTLHPELNRRVGTVELAKPGRRLEAIGAVERTLAATPEDAEAWKLKRLLYVDVTEAEYDAGPVTAFDHAYVEQLGLALIANPNRWRRGAEYLRLAARGMPQSAPTLYTKIGEAFERAGDGDEARRSLEIGKKVGLAVGVKALSDDERQVFFALVRRLAEDAEAREDIPVAIENYQLYAQFEKAGLETYRTLARLFEQQGDALGALRANEQGLVYNAKDRDLLARRDRYYFSVMPDQLRAAPDHFKQAVDVGYCLSKARQVLDYRDSEYEALEWAEHLIELAEVVQPGSLAARVMLARAKLRRGEREDAVAILESVRTPKPEKFGADDEENAWFFACRLLGDLYLRELERPDLAVECFTAYRTSSKSGADTLFKLGEAYERLGEVKRAAKFYEQVTAYDEHPLAPDARAALMRVRE